MDSEHATKLVEAFARLIGALAWPTALTLIVLLLRPALLHFLSTLSELRLKGAGFEASAQRQLNFDTTSRKLHDFWKPGGKVDAANLAEINACMRQLGITDSVAWLINAGTPEDRARVASCLSLRESGDEHA